ncbi:Inner membrane protein alx [Fundidesulfovibrio magnetotacticus]|uniref:Inner membrane protein alx n=1 Tax=Fundidesulfovibrio magnetotacticus TaxID=2730080 RepID=A0A6V8LYJ1_9BACT|nr:TerC/Alx family metal homeostasis membrane protein [Fundidesulfovibrio magnetotacticus]GFK95298.1 Inner membrane protein alx [Fundidesulfovibrio magnetotacticus]
MIGDYSLFEAGLFMGIVALSLWTDLKAHTRDEAVSVRSAALWSGFWILLAFAFSGYVGATHGWGDASLFLTGYILEKSLSVDNLFVIMAIFSSFCIKDAFQHRVLYYGILGALALRLVFVAAGSTLVMIGGKYVLGFFGLFVLWSAYKMWKETGGDDGEIEDYTDHFSVRWTKKFFPVHPFMKGHDFFTRENGRLHATPLFLCLVCVEIADVMFAFDSVPAVIAVTQKPFLVYTSNIFAILGLRSLYFLLAAAKRYLCHLEKAVIGILVFIGLKMLVDVAGIVHISPQVSLTVVSTLLAFGIIGSYMFPEPLPAAEHADRCTTPDSGQGD